MISITLFFEFYNLYFANLSALYTGGLAVVIIAISSILYVWTIKTLRLAKELPEEKHVDQVKRRKLRRGFLLVIIIEVIGFNIAPFILLYFNHIDYIVPVEILICAIHFFPLAEIFKMPVYYFLGGIVTILTVVVLLFVPSSLKMGNLLAVAALSSIGFIIANLLIIIYVLNDARKYLEKPPVKAA